MRADEKSRDPPIRWRAGGVPEHTASRGQIHADAEIRIAIGEIAGALKPGAAPPAGHPAASPPAAPAGTGTAPTTRGKPAR